MNSLTYFLLCLCSGRSMEVAGFGCKILAGKLTGKDCWWMGDGSSECDALGTFEYLCGH